MKKWMLRIAAGLLAGAAIIWGVDEVSFHLNIPRRPQYGNIHVEHYKVVTEKYNLTSWDRLAPEEKRCANAVLPHEGSPPCWYVARHRVETERIN